MLSYTSQRVWKPGISFCYPVSVRHREGLACLTNRLSLPKSRQAAKLGAKQIVKHVVCKPASLQEQNKARGTLGSLEQGVGDQAPTPTAEKYHPYTSELSVCQSQSPAQIPDLTTPLSPFLCLAGVGFLSPPGSETPAPPSR